MRMTTSIAKPLGAVLAAGVVVAISATITPLAAAQPTARPAPGMSQKEVRESPDGKYIVGLSAPPVALYAGGVDGLARTQSFDGVHFSRSTSAVKEYRSYLDDERDAVLESVPGVEPFYEYDWAYSGFAASMTYEQAKKLAGTPGVASVVPNEIYKIDTTRTPTFLGISEPGGLWEQAGGPENAGEGLVIGLIDTGITPESESFAPLAEPAPVPAGWTGTCDPGDPDDLGGGSLTEEGTQGTQPAALDCQGDVLNNKVIGARYYAAGFGSGINPDDFLSPRDAAGHGSHTASTAGGNNDVQVTIAGAEMGAMSGMAPRARIAMYKACWERDTGADLGGCASADTTAGIDQAVSDGVDVINYSIGGSLDSANGPDATAFRAAAAAGIFVAASAGNAGTSGLSTVAHNYPWVTTVAASTQDRALVADAVSGDGDTWTGTSISTGVGPAHVIYAANAPTDQGTTSAATCQKNAIDPAKIAGKIVVCIRGFNGRVEKSQNVKDAGGIGMILLNQAVNGESTNTERHAVPTVHMGYSSRQAILDYVGETRYKPDAMMTITPYRAYLGLDVTAPNMADFSSRGPALMAAGDILKPDISGPGVDIIAAIAPYDRNAYENFAFLSGTSMSSPHIAGLAALLKYLHPDWSPMAIKSAMMTSAYQKNNQGDPIKYLDTDATPFEYGAGHVAPNAATMAPLIYDSTPDQWVQWMCGTQQISPTDPQCVTGGSIDASELNSASIAINDVAGMRAVTRTVSNPTDAEVVATLSLESPPGFDVTVAPDQLTVAAGGTASYTVTFATTDAALDEWRFGSLTWETSSGNVRSPIAIKATSFSAAPLLMSDQASGSVTDLTTSGIEGTINVSSWGLNAAQVDSQVLTDPGGFPGLEPGDPLPPNIMRAVVNVAPDAAMARFELFEEDYAPTTDLDLYVFLNGVKVGESAGGSAGEKVTLINPEPGEYHAYVSLFSLPGGETEVEASLNSWAVQRNGSGDFTVTPESFEGTVGSQQEMVYAWTGLEGPPPLGVGVNAAPDVVRYLGIARYLYGEDQIAETMMRVDVGRGGTTSPPTSSPPPTTSEPPTTSPPTETTTPVPTTTLPGTGGGSAGLFAGLGAAALLAGGLIVALAARRLKNVN